MVTPLNAAGSTPGGRRVVLHPANSVTVLTATLANRISTSATRTFQRRHGIGSTDWRVLSTLAAHPGVTGKDLSSLVAVDQAAVSRSVRRLATQGLLSIGPGQAQRNHQRLELTDQGFAVHDAALETADERERILLQNLKPDEHALLRDLLRRMLAGSGDLGILD